MHAFGWSIEHCKNVLFAYKIIILKYRCEQAVSPPLHVAWLSISVEGSEIKRQLDSGTMA